MDLGWLWWLGAALVLGVVEMLTVDLLFLMLAGGAVAAALAGALGLPFVVQLLVAAVVAVLLLFGVRLWSLAKLKFFEQEYKSGVDEQSGRIGSDGSDGKGT